MVGVCGKIGTGALLHCSTEPVLGTPLHSTLHTYTQNTFVGVPYIFLPTPFLCVKIF